MQENDPANPSLVRDLHVAATAKLVEALVQSENRMRLRLDLLTEVVFEVNQSFEITFLNRAWVAVGGRKIESMRGKPFLDVFVEEDRPLVQAFITGLDPEGGSGKLTCRIDRPDGQECWVELSAVELNGAGWVGNMRDVTRSKYALDQLQLLSLVANHTDNFVIITDAAGLARWINRSFTDFTGYSLAEIYGRPPGSILQGPDTDPKEVARLGAHIRAQKSVQSEILNYTKSGEPYWVTLHLTPIFDDDGVLESYIAVQSNTTEMHELNRQLSEQKSRAESANEAKTQFLSNISHEIRTPLNAMIGFLNLLGRTGLGDNQTGYVQKMNTASHHLLRLINDILDFSKVEARMMELDSHRFVIADVMQDVADILVAECMAKDLVVDIRIDPQGARQVLGDSQKLRQVLLNITSNAVKFTNRGRVRLELTASSAEGGNLSATFRITDTGIGMTDEQIAKIFDEFSQAEASTTRRFGGTGLGLAISQRLVHLMGGHIVVTSTPQVGSSFQFTLSFPIAAPDLRPALGGPTQRREKPLAGLSLLLVEDNEINQMVASEILEAEGATLDIVNNGAEGVAAVRSAPTRYDLVLMDIHMPVMDGLEAARHIVSAYPWTRIIAMTANTAPEDMRDSAAAGMLAHVGKPFEVSELVETILRVTGEPRPAAPDEGNPLASPAFLAFRRLLEDSDMDALDAFEALVGNGRFADRPWMDHVAAALEQLDFEAALSALPEIKDETP